VLYGFMRALERTIRWTEVNPESTRSLWAAGKRVIVVFWHNRMLMAPFFYRGRGLKILISRHTDGELISRVMARFGFGSVRGSTRRGGTGAFRELVRSGDDGFDIVITPDGPRGPRYVVQKGVIELARQTGLPVVPVTYSTQRRVHCPSWDAFLIPGPFTKGVFIFGRPLWVDPEATAEERESLRGRLEEYLRLLTERADSFFQPVQPRGSA
jgi:hypothetical protein